MKEYTFFTSPVKEFRQSIRRSFQCMPKNEERRSNIVSSSSSSSPRFFSWKCRTNSVKRNQHSPHPQQQPPPPPISMSSPSSPLMMEKEQISSCSSPQLVRLHTPKPVHIDEQRSLITPKPSPIKPIDENGNQLDMDEHIQIALYAQQLASLNEKQKQNPSGIPPPIRFPSCPMNLQMNNNQFHSKVPTPSTMIPMSSIRSMQMDHQSAEKRLVISKLEAKNRRILREINTLRAPT